METARHMEITPPKKSPAPRRLAFVITELEPGGAERCLVELATRLDRLRFSPVVYSLAARPVEGRQALVARLAEAQIPTCFLGFSRVGQYFAAVRELANRLREQQAELVQTFLFHGNVIGSRAALAAGTPHLVTGIRVADPRWWRTALERVATATADRFVCVSQSVAEFSRRRGFAAEKLAVIPNGVDLARWQEAEPANFAQLGLPTGRRILLFVGRLDKQKGLDRFFGELPALFRELPQHDLVLVGAGQQQEALGRRASAAEWGHRVHFLGWRDDVPALMSGCEMLVLPSRWEGMPNVVLEAMAAGKPVIATQSEGTVELLGLGALEQTVALGDWAGLRATIIELARDPALSANMGLRNQRRAEQFSLDFMADRYQRLYESLFA
jgi:glycosyltransferase involved in cell wall biosynthesis